MFSSSDKTALCITCPELPESAHWETFIYSPTIPFKKPFEFSAKVVFNFLSASGTALFQDG